MDANIGFGRLWYSYDEGWFASNDVNGSMFNFAVGPGLDFRLKNGFYLELLVQYLYMRNISFPEQTSAGNSVIPSIGVIRHF